MTDPRTLVEAARANGEPHLAEWIQREAETYTRQRRIRTLRHRLTVTAGAAAIAAVLIWCLSAWAALIA